MLAAGELFTLIAYAQLILENAKLYQVEADLLEEIFALMIRDFSECALEMVLNYDLSTQQESYFQAMIQKPLRNQERFNRLWENHVLPLKDAY